MCPVSVELATVPYLSYIEPKIELSAIVSNQVKYSIVSHLNIQNINYYCIQLVALLNYLLYIFKVTQTVDSA